MRIEHGNSGILGLASDQNVAELVQQLEQLGTSDIFQVHDLFQMMATPQIALMKETYQQVQILWICSSRYPQYSGTLFITEVS